MNRLETIVRRQRRRLTALALFALLVATAAIGLASAVGPALR